MSRSSEKHIRHDIGIIPGLLALALLLALVPVRAQQPENDSPCNQGRAIPPRIDPRNDFAICLPVLGTMTGLIDTTVKYNRSEEFGHIITPLGDIDGDSIDDFAVNHYRTDTIIGHLADEVLIYKGVRGGLPDVASGQRIGPDNTGADMKLVAAADWDHDGFIDLALYAQLHGDTSFGNTEGYDLGEVIIYWGNAAAQYSNRDTTHMNIGFQAWGTVWNGLSGDFDRDGTSDLLLRTEGAGFFNGKWYPTAPFLLFRGRPGHRWGRDDHMQVPDWTWWKTPPVNSIGHIDQDCDGAIDIVLYDNEHAGTGHLSVLYGNPNGGLPDTSDVETIDLLNPNGHYSLLSDITGDGVPEIILNTGSEELIKVWAGRHGMRLKEQYGTGLDEPPTQGWTSRPWATIWAPAKINDYWSSTGFDPLYDCGDIDLDGVNDIMAVSTPYLICYLGGRRLDSLVDALVKASPNPLYVSRVGNIDGSGKSTIAVFTTPDPVGWNPNPGSITFVQPTKDVSHEPYARTIPPGTDQPCAASAAVDVPMSDLPASDLKLELDPNPARGELHLRWQIVDDQSGPIVTVSDASGRELRRMVLAPGAGSAGIGTTGLAKGIYFLTLRVGERSATVRAVVE